MTPLGPHLHQYVYKTTISRDLYAVYMDQYTTELEARGLLTVEYLTEKAKNAKEALEYWTKLLEEIQ